MKVDNVGISEDYWKSKSLEEFAEHFTGKLRSDRIKIAYDMLPKIEVEKQKVKKPSKKKMKVDVEIETVVIEESKEVDVNLDTKLED